MIENDFILEGQFGEWGVKRTNYRLNLRIRPKIEPSILKCMRWLDPWWQKMTFRRRQRAERDCRFLGEKHQRLVLWIRSTIDTHYLKLHLNPWPEAEFLTGSQDRWQLSWWVTYRWVFHPYSHQGEQRRLQQRYESLQHSAMRIQIGRETLNGLGQCCPCISSWFEKIPRKLKLRR